VKKYIDKINKTVILLFGCISVLVILLVATIHIKSNNKVILSEGALTIYTSAKEYTPTSIKNLYVENKTKLEQKEVEAVIVKEEKIEEEKQEEVIEELVEEQPKVEEQPIIERNEVYNGMTIEELSDKLNRSLNSTVAGYGNLFATYSLEKNVDPYLAVAIMLHETGCKWTCSELVRSCNNVGGQKGSPSCGSGSYRRFDTLEDGIRGYIDNLSANYFALGLNTPETISRKYTGYEGGTWATKVNSYIEQIKAN